MTIEAATAFRAALLGVKVMHDGGWLHRDLKPTNIGLIGKPLRSVLLDVGTSRHIQAGGLLRPEPGTVGTVGYLAPELELENSIDIWSMGIILFELTYNYHPWKYAINPWRDGETNEALRPSFQRSYQNAADEWPMGHTPPEIKEKRNAEVKAHEELEGATSDDSSDNNNDDKDKGGSIDAGVNPENPVASDRPRVAEATPNILAPDTTAVRRKPSGHPTQEEAAEDIRGRRGKRVPG